MRTSTRPRRLAALVGAAGLLLAAVAPSSASAAKSTPTYNGITCTVTATAPTLSSTKQLTGNASIACTKTTSVTATSVTVNYVITVAEMDFATGTTTLSVEQALSTSFQKSLSAVVTFGKTTTITSYTLACPNTDSDNEEYVSKARVQIVGSTFSLDDRSATPKNNAFGC